MRHHDYEVCSAEDGLQAREIFEEKSFDLVVLDIMLPHEDGLSLLKEFKKQQDIPVIMLTALSDVKTESRSFDLLADDYISKPFSLVLLEKRIQAVLRRYRDQAVNVWEYGKAKVNFKSYTASYEDKAVDMTPKEIEVLQCLLKDANQVLTREQILDQLWQDRYPSDRVIDVYIKNLRKKLKLDCIKTVKGVGYRLELER